jgi:hypothetical protein
MMLVSISFTIDTNWKKRLNIHFQNIWGLIVGMFNHVFATHILGGIGEYLVTNDIKKTQQYLSLHLGPSFSIYFTKE